ncbi:MAG: hypothetical protein MZV49_17905 [Rhodopseudomonas palustris]|nr:hypothetical protein [Rhodopseudomonas palustris]
MGRVRHHGGTAEPRGVSDARAAATGSIGETITHGRRAARWRPAAISIELREWSDDDWRMARESIRARRPTGTAPSATEPPRATLAAC